MRGEASARLRPVGTIGFVGLGVMGGAMCANLVRRAGRPVIAFDARADALAQARLAGARGAACVSEIAEACDLVLLSLPDHRAVEQVVFGAGGLVHALKRGGLVVDTSTSDVTATRRFRADMAGRALAFIDAPVARTREAALKGELSIMVGASAAEFEHVAPILATMGTDVTHCGPSGAGQVAKILNNMLLFLNVQAIAEAMAVGRRCGIDEGTLLTTIAKGSGDSFALRNHAMKAMLPRAFPEQAFSTDYAMKDLRLALSLADAAGVAVPAARLAMERFAASAAAGNASRYFPAVLDVIDRNNGK